MITRTMWQDLYEDLDQESIQCDMGCEIWDRSGVMLFVELWLAAGFMHIGCVLDCFLNIARLIYLSCVSGFWRRSTWLRRACIAV